MRQIGLMLVLAMSVGSCRPSDPKTGGAAAQAKDDPTAWVVVRHRADGTPFQCWVVGGQGVGIFRGDVSWRLVVGNSTYEMHVSEPYTVLKATREMLSNLLPPQLGVALEHCTGGLYHGPVADR